MENLKLLESRIEEILAQHAQLRDERDRLQKQLEEVQAHLGEVTSRLECQERERTEIKDRVDRILGRLDGLGVGA